MMEKKSHVAIIGQGYVGLPLSMAAVQAGYQVSGIDSDSHKVESLSSGHSWVEDVPDALVQAAVRDLRYVPSDDFQQATGFSTAIITVPTPLRGGAPDLSFVESAASSLAPMVTAGCTVVLESTTYPGTTEELVLPILERGSRLVAGTDFFLGYSPERIDPGNPEWTLLNTPKVVSGINANSLEKVRSFYESLGISVVPVSGTREAEMTKLLENTFRHVNIALVNELAKFSSQLGVNLWEAIDAASTKPFGFMRFTPGPGVGGHCLPIDPSYLSWAVKDKVGEDFRFVSLANEVNNSMPQFVVARANQILKRLCIPMENASILLLGLAYKAGTGDTRESPATEIARILQDSGSDVSAVDSYVSGRNWPTSISRVTREAAKDFDLAIVVTEHGEFGEEWVCNSANVVLDTRNFIAGANVEKL